MKKVDFNVTVEDAFLYGTLEGQRKIVNDLVSTFCKGDDHIDKKFFMSYLELKLSMLNEFKEYANILSAGIRESK